jgi:hypothetical protein
MSQPYDQDQPQEPYGTPPPAQQPRKTHKIRNTLLGSVVALVVLVAITAALGGSKTPRPATAAAASTTPASTTAQAPASTAAPSPTPVPPTTVKFIVSGYAPGDGYGNGPTINYGSNGSTHEADPADISGTLTYSVPFDPSASYYSLNAQLEGSGHLSCKIVVTGPYPDVPLTVSHGTAEGGYSICSAQAAPSDPSGLSWQDEQ